MTLPPDSTVCHNCRAPLAGPFCAACGQQAAPLNPRLHDLLRDVTHEMLNVDGRIFASVRRLLTSPGFLTVEQIEGRRAPWIPPLRLYLLFSLLYFGIAAVTPGATRVGVTGTDAETRTELQRLGFSSEQELQQAVAHAQKTWTPRVMFVLVPLFAWLVQVASRRSGRNYPQHLYFALHVHAAWFAVGTIAAGAAALTGSPILARLSSWATVLYGASYLALAFRRAYGLSLGRAVKRTLLVGVLYWIAVTLAIVAIVLPAVFGHE